MNFYPLLIQSIADSKKLKLYLISNLAWIVVIILIIIGWQLWWHDFFDLVKTNLTATAVNGETVKLLTEKIKHIASQLLLFVPIWLVLWRLLLPVSIHAIEQKPWTQYFAKSAFVLVFDLIKLLLVVLVYSVEKNTISSYPLLSAGILVISIFIFSILYYIQIAFFIEKPEDHVKAIAAAWYHHLPEVLFLHAIDIGIGLISFCVFGLIMASFTYLPFILFCILALLFTAGLAKLWLIRKILWVYSISNMLKITTT